MQEVENLLSELSYIPSTLFVSEVTYTDFLDRVHLRWNYAQKICGTFHTHGSIFLYQKAKFILLLKECSAISLQKQATAPFSSIQLTDQSNSYIKCAIISKVFL